MKILRMEDFACTFISGAIGGVGLVAVGQPFDTVKTKLQTFPELYQKSGALHCAKSIYRSEGISGLYAGSLPAIMGTGMTHQFNVKGTLRCYDSFNSWIF